MNSIVKDTENASKYYRRYDPFETPMVQKIVSAYEKFFFSPKLEDFDDITTKTFNFIYRMCLTPDIQVQTIILNIYERLQSISERLQERATTDQPLLSQQQTQTDVLTQQSQGAARESKASIASQATTASQPLVLPTFLLTRFVFVIGYTAMKEMIYLDIDVYSNLKYRQDLKEEKKNLRKSAHNLSRASVANMTLNKRKTMSLDQSASASASKAGNKKRNSGQQEQDQDEQMVRV
jgi:condensin complex subunit 1